MMYFLLEYNLKPLQQVLRSSGHSVFLSYDGEIGLPADAEDSAIVERVIEQKEALGIDRIIITKDKKFITHLGSAPIKLIVLTDKMMRYNIYSMNLMKLGDCVVRKALELINEPEGQKIAYVECSKFY